MKRCNYSRCENGVMLDDDGGVSQPWCMFHQNPHNRGQFMKKEDKTVGNEIDGYGDWHRCEVLGCGGEGREYRNKKYPEARGRTKGGMLFYSQWLCDYHALTASVEFKSMKNTNVSPDKENTMNAKTKTQLIAERENIDQAIRQLDLDEDIEELTDDERFVLRTAAIALCTLNLDPFHAQGYREIVRRLSPTLDVLIDGGEYDIVRRLIGFSREETGNKIPCKNPTK